MLAGLVVVLVAAATPEPAAVSALTPSTVHANPALGPKLFLSIAKSCEYLLRVSARADGTMRRLVVEDTGPGIPPADIERVFERFYRVDKSRARPGGTGLGLAIVRQAAEAHGGTVELESAPGKGTTFRVRLPGATEAPA